MKEGRSRSCHLTESLLIVASSEAKSRLERNESNFAISWLNSLSGFWAKARVGRPGVSVRKMERAAIVSCQPPTATVGGFIDPPNHGRTMRLPYGSIRRRWVAGVLREWAGTGLLDCTPPVCVCSLVMVSCGEVCQGACRGLVLPGYLPQEISDGERGRIVEGVNLI